MINFRPLLAAVTTVVLTTHSGLAQNQVQTLKGSKKKIQENFNALGDNSAAKIKKNMELQVQVTDKNGNLVNKNLKVKRGQTVRKTSRTNKVVVGEKEVVVGQKVSKSEDYTYEAGLVKDKVNSKGYVEGSNIYAGKGKLDGSSKDTKSGKSQRDIIAESQKKYSGMSKDELKAAYEKAKYKDKNGNAIVSEEFNSSVARKNDRKNYDVKTGEIKKTESTKVEDIIKKEKITKDVKEQSVTVSGGKKSGKLRGRSKSSHKDYTVKAGGFSTPPKGGTRSKTKAVRRYR